MSRESLPRREDDVHLVEAEVVLFSGCFRGYKLVAIQDIGDESGPLGIRYALAPLNHGDFAECLEAGSGLKIPCLVTRLNADDAKALLFGQLCVLLWRQVQIRITEVLEITSPAWREARLLDSGVGWLESAVAVATAIPLALAGLAWAPVAAALGRSATVTIYAQRPPAVAGD